MKINKKKIIKDIVGSSLQLPDFQNTFREYLRHYRKNGEFKSDFSSEDEYDKYLEEHPLRTLKDEKVKSLRELDIANHLALNGIRYEYEPFYEHKVQASEYSQYTPDFYLPDYKIYIEFYGIDKDGNVPSWFSPGKNGENASEYYQAGMKWKKSTHEKCGTTLVECYAYEGSKLFSNLDSKLKAHGVLMISHTIDALCKKMNENGVMTLRTICKSFQEMIKLSKNMRFPLESIDPKKTQKNGSTLFKNYSLIFIKNTRIGL